MEVVRARCTYHCSTLYNANNPANPAATATPAPACTLPAAPVFSGDADPVADPVEVTGPPRLCGTVLKYTVGNALDVGLPMVGVALVPFVLTVTV
jgi:hypothetical protein